MIEKGSDIYQMRLMISGIRNAYKAKTVDYGLVEYIYYHCIDNIG